MHESLPSCLAVVQDTAQAGPWEAGQQVDVWDDGGWWETRVKDQTPREQHCTLEGIVAGPVSHDLLRVTTVWDGHAFSSGALQPGMRTI